METSKLHSYTELNIWIKKSNTCGKITMHFQRVWADEIFPMLPVWVSLQLTAMGARKKTKKTYFLGEKSILKT